MSTVSKRRTLLGLLFIMIGGILMIHWTNLIPFFRFPTYIFNWQMILIILGLFFLITERNRSTGLVLFVIGALFLAPDVFNVTFRQVLQFAIPGLFLLAGILLILPSRNLLGRRKYKKDYEGDANDYIRDVNIFSGGTKAITSGSFKGGELTCIFGGTELNFRNANLAPGVNVLEVACIFGGVKLFIPEDWTVKLEITPIFGGFTDSRAESNMRLATDPDKILVVKGTAIFGGGEIKVV